MSISGVYFVLNGFINGDRDALALTVDGTTQTDGWYYTREGESDGQGPYETQQDAVEAGTPTLDDLDVDDILDVLWAGKLRPLMADDRMAYADASSYALCGSVGPFFVLFDLYPGEGQPPHCEVHLGDEFAIVNLREGTWARA